MFRIGFIWFYFLGLNLLYSNYAFSKENKITEISAEQYIYKLYIDFLNRKPSSNEFQFLKNKILSASGDLELRIEIRKILINDLLSDDSFERKIRNYFTNIMGLSNKTASVLSLCSNSSRPCLNEEDITDLKFQTPMFIAKSLLNSDINSAIKKDIRSILNSSMTILTPRLAKLLVNNSSLQEKFGLINIDKTRLIELSKINSEQWFFIDRDPENKGIATGTDNHRERHSGVLTDIIFLSRSPSHLSRANNFYSWFMCRTLEQANIPETLETKLVLRSPCSSCHSILEPLGSFWVHWRAKQDFLISDQNWVLDGTERLSNKNIPTSNDGQIPLDINDPDSLHSRSVDGSFLNFKGKGVRSLGDAIVKDKGFGQCMVKHGYQILLGRPMVVEESGLATLFEKRLASIHTWDFRETLLDIILSSNYSGLVYE